MNPRKKHVILADYNERAQAVDGLEQAGEIMEIVDHHRTAPLRLSNPITFRNVPPVGCTCTIIYGLYHEYGIDIPKILLALCSSVILFPDYASVSLPAPSAISLLVQEACRDLWRKTLTIYSEQMSDAGADLTGRTAERVFL